jgi:hypothetical protein
MVETYTSAGQTTDLAKDPIGTVENALETQWLADTTWWTATNTALVSIRPDLGITTADIKFGYYPEDMNEGRIWVNWAELTGLHDEPDIPGMFTVTKMFADLKVTVRDTQHHRRGHRTPLLIEVRAYLEKWIKQHKRAFKANGITHILLQDSNIIEKDEVSDYHDLVITILFRVWKVSSIMI